MVVRSRAWLAMLALLVGGFAWADEPAVEQAREALGKKDDDADSAKALEQVFQASEQSYTLLKKGERTLTYGFDYSLVRDVVIETFRTGDNIYSVVGQSEAQHTFTNSFTFDYGIWDNLTFSIRLPLVAVYDTERSLDAYSLGDISTSLRWQPCSNRGWCRPPSGNRVVPNPIHRTGLKSYQVRAWMHTHLPCVWPRKNHGPSPLRSGRGPNHGGFCQWPRLANNRA